MADEPAYLKNLRATTRGAIETEEELRTHERELYGQNDRATALLFGTLVERSLEDLLRTKMREDGAGKIFGTDGILASFGSKITMAYSLSLIGPVVRHDMNIIRHLRNEFAHATKHFSFSTPAVKPVCDALTILDRSEPEAIRAIMFWSEKDKEMAILTDATVPKTRFMLTCHDLSYRMLVARGKVVEPIKLVLGKPVPREPLP